MKHTFEILPENRTILNYENLLSQFDSWKYSKREVVLSQVLESDKKIELFVEIDNSQKGGQRILKPILYVEGRQGDYFRYKTAVIKSIKFVIKDNKVLNVRVELESTFSAHGLRVSELFESGYELQLLEEIDLKDNITGFYFILPNQAA